MWRKWAPHLSQVKCLTVSEMLKRAPDMIKALLSVPRVDRLIPRINSFKKVITRPEVWLSFLVPVLLAFLKITNDGKFHNTHQKHLLYCYSTPNDENEEVMVSRGATFIQQTLFCLF